MKPGHSLFSVKLCADRTIRSKLFFLFLSTLTVSPMGISSQALAGSTPTLARTGTHTNTKTDEYWYTVSVAGIPYGYYLERFEKRPNHQIFFQNQFWKKEEGFINEEQLGALAEDTPELKPLFFNFHSNYRQTETTIDGNVQGVHELTVKIRKDGKDLPVIKKNLPPGAFLSVLFPIWLERKLAQLRPGKPVSFLTVFEDNLDIGFVAVSGTLRLEPGDEYSRQSKTKMIRVQFDGNTSYWYIDQNGFALRIVSPKENRITDRVTAEAAKKFLKP